MRKIATNTEAIQELTRLTSLAGQPQPSRKRLAAELLRLAGRFTLGPGGLGEPASKITLQDGAAYYLGASSSPNFVILTGVSDDRIRYKSYPFNGSELRMERWIAADLLTKGTETHLKTYGAHMDPDLKRSMASLLRGGKGRKEDIKDYLRVEVTVEATDKDQDLWYVAEEYGGVGGLIQDDGTTHYVIITDNKRVEQIKNDRRFKILNVKKG